MALPGLLARTARADAGKASCKMVLYLSGNPKGSRCKGSQDICLLAIACFKVALASGADLKVRCGSRERVGGAGRQ